MNKIKKSTDSSKKLFIVVSLFALFTVPTFYYRVDQGLDPSWKYILNLLWLNSDYKFGTNIAFSYGPLGFLDNPLPINGCHIWALIIYGTSFLGQVYLFYRIAQRLKNHTAILIIGLLTIVIFNPSYSAELYIQFSIFLALSVLWHERNRLASVIYFYYVSIAFFYKWNIIVSIVAMIVIMSLFHVITRSFKQLFVLWFPLLSFPILYLIYNPSIRGLIGYIKYGLVLASGFSESMSLPGDQTNLSILLILIVVIVAIYLLIIIYELFGNFKNAVLMVSFLPCYFVAYKHGYVRVDTGHTMVTINEIVILSFVFLLTFNTEIVSAKTRKLISLISANTINKILSISTLCIIMFGLVTTGFEDIPLSKLGYKFKQVNHFFEDLNDTSRIHNEPTDDNTAVSSDLIQLIGDNSFTIFSSTLSWINRYPDLLDQYKIMPGIQPYAMLTPALDQMNASFFDGESAPQYVLLSCGTIDWRLPLIETPETWRNIYQNYEYCDSDSKYVLLKKVTKVVSDSEKITETLIFSKYDIIDVSAYDEIKINSELNLKGIITKTLCRIPPIHMTVEFDDGCAYKGRVVMPNLSEGFRTDYLPLNCEEIKLLLSDSHSGRKITRILFSEEGVKYYKDQIELIGIKYN